MLFLLIRETIVSRYLAKIVESSTFLRPENAFLPSLEIHVSRVPSFVWANFPYYGILKMIFLLIRETNVSRYLARELKFSSFLKSTFQEYRDSCQQIFRMYEAWCKPIFGIWHPENTISAELRNQRFKVPRKGYGNFHNFWGLKMRFYPVVKSTIQSTELRVSKFCACTKPRVS